MRERHFLPTREYGAREHAERMDLELALTLVVLALVDATSLGTLVIPVWFLLMPGRPRVGRMLTYLAAVVGSYVLLGFALLAGALVFLERISAWFAGSSGAHVLLAVGAVMFLVGVCMPTKKDAEPGRLMRRITTWRDRAMGADGDAGVKAVVALAVVAVLVEAGSMVPYLAAIGLLSAAPMSTPERGLALVAYCLVMVVPALLCLAARLILHERIERPLQRFGAWIERTSHENLAWALAIIGFLLVRHAWMAGARPPWM